MAGAHGDSPLRVIQDMTMVETVHMALQGQTYHAGYIYAC